MVRRRWCVWLPSPCPVDDLRPHWKLLKPEEKEENERWRLRQTTAQDVDAIKYDRLNVTGVSPSVPADATGPTGIPGWGPGREMGELITVPPPLLSLCVCNETRSSATLVFIRRNVFLLPEWKDNTSCLSTSGTFRNLQEPSAGLLDIQHKLP